MNKLDAAIILAIIIGALVYITFQIVGWAT